MITNHKVIRYLITTILLISMVSSCTVYYKTSDLKKNFTQASKDTGKSQDHIKKDLDEKQSIYDQLITLSSDPMITPYPLLANHLLDMTTQLNQIDQTHQKFIGLKTRFMLLAKGRKKIETNTPLYKDYKSLKSEFDDLAKVFENHTQAYEKHSNHFVLTINKHKISEINIADLKKKLNTYMKDLDASIEEVNVGIKDYRVRASKKKLAKNASVLDQLELIVADISEKREQMSILIKGFEAETKGVVKVWSGPGMHTYTIMNDIMTLGDQISADGKKFDEISKQI